ncbi:hypothetical protein BCR32DRAFT_264070 [Anaeromyces robustus]|uniref:Swi5-dependent recombination DNA repair protein 1 homolog n=1 Tax=Anaeromyces robustus TaxID=1754192 RepID=A0A1Y1XQ57_9FUNG|nr:hypothetical protein BCR32DRAFT_264070 [Anaeromyces robustus]|eukprot:ORX87646.1 hypothetical protein BCR32DRAFT_264070 [Anaeromyces robustus]
MEDSFLSIFNDNKPISKKEIETKISKSSSINDINKKTSSISPSNKMKLLNKSSNLLHKNTTFKSPLLKNVNKTSRGISKSFQSPLIHNNNKSKLKTNEIQGLLNIKNKNFNRSAPVSSLLKFKKDKELLNKIKERDALLNQLKQKEENIRRINLVLKHRETNEVEKLKLLICKWRKTSQTITEVLKEKIGQVMVANAYDNGIELKEVTLEQILNGLNINPSILNYDKEEDCFNNNK